MTVFGSNVKVHFFKIHCISFSTLITEILPSEMELKEVSTVVDANESQKTKSVGIIGYGNYGKALASRLKAVGADFLIGTRSVHTWRADGIEESQFVTYKEAAAKSDIIILAIPAFVYDEVAPQFADIVAGKTVVDISNADKISDGCHAERLADLLPGCHIVKAFNTISAWSMQNDIYGASRNVFVCGDDIRARKTVMQLAQEMGFSPVEQGRLKAASLLEKKPLQLFPEWRTAFWITLAMLIFQIIYLHGRYLAFTSDPSKLINSIFLKYPNRITGWMVLWLLGVVFLAGCIAAILQLIRGTKYSTFPNWLDAWMKARKQLGLFALLFVGMHACLSCILLAGEYFSGMSNTEKIPGVSRSMYYRYKWNAELSLLFATLSTTLLVILGLTSLPTVNQSMSWREWDFVQSKLGYLSMLFGFLHIFFYVYKGMFRAHSWKYGLPHHTFLMLLLPFIVLMLKFVLIMPGVNGMLMRIRKGWERGKKRQTTQL